MSKRILVTGGSGKAGQYVLADLQAHGYQVVNGDRRRADKVRNIEVDLCDIGHVYAAMSGIDAVVHLAAIPAPGSHPPEVVMQTNLMSTFNVLQAAAVLGIKKVVLASSLSALGLAYAFRPVALDYFPIDEAHPLLAQDEYGLSKIMGENLAEGFARRDPLLSLTSLRFTWIMSPEEVDTLLPTLQADDASRASVLWTYIDARDVATCIRLSLEHDQPGHSAFYINAPTTFTRRPTLDLLQTYYPDVPRDADKLSGTTAPIDCSAARQVLSFDPEFVWKGA